MSKIIKKSKKTNHIKAGDCTCLTGCVKHNNKTQFASCLAKVPIFSHLSEVDQASIVDLIKVRKTKKNEIIYNSGQQNPYLYVLHEGKIKISRYNENGDEQVVRILLPGDFIGQNALFNNKPSTDFAISLEDSALCVLSGEKLKKHMEKHPAISMQIISELTKRLLDAENKMEQFNLSSVEQRLAKSILDFSENQHSFTLPISKVNWASLLGMSSETLSRKLREFKESGVIELKGQRGIKVLNKSFLKNLI